MVCRIRSRMFTDAFQFGKYCGKMLPFQYGTGLDSTCLLELTYQFIRRWLYGQDIQF